MKHFNQLWGRFSPLPFLVLLLSSLATLARAEENVLEKVVTLQVHHAALSDALGRIEQEADVKFVYSPQLIQADRVINIRARNARLGSVLERLFERSGIAFEAYENQIVLIGQGDAAPLVAVEVMPIEGVIRDEKGEAVPGASIAVKGKSKGTITDGNGRFRLDADEKDVLVISSTGYITQEISVGSRSSFDIVLQSNEAVLSEVAIVGSRARTARTFTETAVPVDVITPKELKGFSQVDVGQILNYVAPSFNSNRQTVTDGTDHLDPASLRGLGPDQVLVLVNGKRRHTSALVNINGSVGRGSVGTDMNVIPVAAIERIEILRDGAAAQYGSDAIAGVINVVLKKQYQGLSASVTTGMHATNMKYEVPVVGGSTQAKNQKLNDGKVFQVDLSTGFKLGKDGGMTVSVQYNERERTNRSGEDNAPTIYLGGNGAFPSTPTGQNQDEFRRKLLTDDATLVARNNYDRRNMVIGNSSSRNIGAFLNGTLPFSDKSQLYWAGGVTYRSGKAFGNNRIPVSRAQQPLNADGSLYYPNGFLPAISPIIQDQSLIAGYKVKLGMWQMDLSNTFGQNGFNFNVEESGNATLPNGTIQTSFDAGTLRFRQNTTNLDFVRKFADAGRLSDLNLALGTELRMENYRIQAGEVASYSGATANKTVPGAPLVIDGPGIGTTLALPGAQVFPGFQPNDEVNKNRRSVALYADTEGELFDRWLVAVAGRFENYSDFGSNISGKLATRLKLTKQIAVRGALSTGFRAPSLHQRYFQNTSTQFVSGLPSNTLTVNNENPIARTFIGVDALRPETSTSATLGLTAGFSKVSLTVDAYQINIEDRIVYSGAFSRALLGFRADEYVGINNVNFFANAANTRTQGVDVVGTYRTDLSKGRLTLTAAANFNRNEVTGINSTALIDSPAKNDPAVSPDNWFRNRLFDRQQQSRIEVLQPRNKVTLGVSYSVNKWDFNLRTVRFGESTFLTNVETEAKKADGTYWNTQFARDANGTAYVDQTFDPVWITDLTVGYRFTDHLSLSLGANNLLDVYPEQVYIDPRNALGTLDYSSGRDASNRGRILFPSNQGGFNGRFIFLRLAGNF